MNEIVYKINYFNFIILLCLMSLYRRVYKQVALHKTIKLSEIK